MKDSFLKNMFSLIITNMTGETYVRKVSPLVFFGMGWSFGFVLKAWDIKDCWNGDRRFYGHRTHLRATL